MQVKNIAKQAKRSKCLVHKENRTGCRQRLGLVIRILTDNVKYISAFKQRRHVERNL